MSIKTSLYCFILLLQGLLVAARPSVSPRHTKEFDLILTWEQHAPDGFSREMFLVNGSSPGPTLEIEQDDWVVVRIHNQSPHDTTVHFHGIEMHRTPWSDGVPGVTQRPIKPGQFFKHEFRATQHGSYWYHSHFRGQIEDGLYGPIVIHPRAGQPKPFHLISNSSRTFRAMEDAERHVVPLVISDFMHITSSQKWDMTLDAGFEDICYDSILFNGKGRVTCLDKDVVKAHLNVAQKTYLSLGPPGSEMTDKACFPPSVLKAFGGGKGNESAVLPGTYFGCEETEGSIEVIKAPRPSYTPSESWVAISFTSASNFISGVVSIDEHDMWVYAVDGSYIKPQKVQGILLHNGDRYSVLVSTHKRGNFKIRFNSDSAPQMMASHAVLSVGSDYNTEAEPTSEPYIDLVGVPLSDKIKLFNPDIAAPYPPSPISQTADALHVLNMRLDGSSYFWALNSSRLMPEHLDKNDPVLFHPHPEVRNNVTISTKNDTWVDLVFYASTLPMPPHPIHKHGNKMYHIGSGEGPFRWSSVEEAMKEIPHQFNLVDPPRRDAFPSPGALNNTAWAVVRYHVTDPGAWTLHCHISNHHVGGMSMVIQDGVDHWPSVPAEYREYGKDEV